MPSSMGSGNLFQSRVSNFRVNKPGCRVEIHACVFSIGVYYPPCYSHVPDARVLRDGNCIFILRIIN